MRVNIDYETERRRKLCGLLIAMLYIRRRRRNRRVRTYMRALTESRQLEGAFTNLVQPMKHVYADEHFNYFRMTATRFEDLLRRVAPYLVHGQNHHQYPISIAERLSSTLRFLASGDSISSLAYNYRMAKSSLILIVRETTKAIWLALVDEYMAIPDRAKWKAIAAEFWETWQFPLCLAAVDGTHVQIKNQPKAGSLFYNYKGFFSIILLAVVDAKYQFIFVDVGGHGRDGDGGVFYHLEFGKRCENPTASFANGGLQIPYDDYLPGTQQKSPYVFIGDQAFKVTRHMMAPYRFAKATKAEHVFNYRLSRARRVVENAFRILKTRFRVVENRIDLAANAGDDVVKACCILHNYLKANDAQDRGKQPQYCPPNYVDTKDENGQLIPGDWHKNSDQNDGLQPLPRAGTARTAEYSVRETLKRFFLSPEGSVPWQDRVVCRTSM